MPLTNPLARPSTRYAHSLADTARATHSISRASAASTDTFSRTSSSGSNWARFSSTPVAAGSANYPSVLSGLSHLGSAQTNNSVDISAEALRTRKRHLSTATLEELQKMAGMFITVRSGEMDVTQLTRAQAEFVVMAQMFGETAVYNQPGFFEKNSMPEDLDARLRDIVRAGFSLPEAIAEVGSLDELLSDVAGLQSLGLDTSKIESWNTFNDLETGILDPDEYFKDVMNGGSDEGSDSGVVSPGGNNGSGGINLGTGTGTGTGTEDPTDGIYYGGNGTGGDGTGFGDDGIVGPGTTGSGGSGGTSSSTSTSPDKKPSSPETPAPSGSGDTEPTSPVTPSGGTTGVDEPSDDEPTATETWVVKHNEDGSFTLTVNSTNEDGEQSQKTATFYNPSEDGVTWESEANYSHGHKPPEGTISVVRNADGTATIADDSEDSNDSSRPKPLGDDRGEIPEDAPMNVVPAPSCPDEELSPVNPDGASIDMNKLLSERISHLIRPNSEAEVQGSGRGPVPAPECDLDGDSGIGGIDGPGSPKPMGNPDDGHVS